MTAAAASTWRPVSLTGSRRASSSSRAPCGQRPVGVGAERVEVLDEQERQALGLLVEAPRELGRGVGDRRAEQLADLVLAQPVQPDDGRRRPPQRRARGQQHEQAAPAEPAQPVGEQAERGLVGPLDVVDHQQPRDRPGRGGGERLPHAVEEPRLRGRPVERRGRGGAEVGQQPRRLAQRAVADAGRPTSRRRAAAAAAPRPPARTRARPPPRRRGRRAPRRPARARTRRAPRPAASCRSPPRPPAAPRRRRRRCRRRRRAAPPIRGRGRPAARAAAARPERARPAPSVAGVSSVPSLIAS